jgi:hypothetical protein
MGEYAIVTATVAAVLVGALANLGSSALPATQSRATVVVAQAARSAGTSPAAARRALARAPYARVQLKTLYALGWIAGTQQRAVCLVATATEGSTAARTRAALRQVKGHAALLRRSNVTEAQAVVAADRGFRDSCTR